MTRLRERLRAETRAAHDRVDAAFARFNLHQRADYAAFLQAHAAALPILEAAVEQGGAERLLPDWLERRRTAALLLDLQRIGAAAPVTPAPPPLESDARTLGALYVLEGSRLGARLLSAQVRESPDPQVRSAAAYLSHGEGRKFWPAFLRVLEERTGDDPAAVVAGALAAFGMFEAAARA